ncbi:MAG: hypothetical protein WC833_11165 [Bacteroidales bacterium]|jgi:uncharacterized protein (TIGR02145 family)
MKKLLIATLLIISASCKKDEIDLTYPGTTRLAVQISGVTWAPINAGYSTERPNGLLYQWGRMYGQEYISTDTIPGPVAISVGNNSTNSSKFFIVQLPPFDWCTPSVTTWDMTLYNPCPAGWRVPTTTELAVLNASGSTWLYSPNDNPDGLPGRWYGGNHNTDHVGSLFLPATGFRNVSKGAATIRGTMGDYWSCEASGIYASSLFFTSSASSMASDYRAGGLPVRCVKK